MKRQILKQPGLRHDDKVNRPVSHGGLQRLAGAGLAHAGHGLALRVGQQRERDVKVRKLGELEAGFFAAPRYLAARGAPRAMTDLAAHETIWPFGDKKASFGAGKTPPPSIACDDFAVVLEVARAGGGVAVLPTHLAKLPVLEGALVRLFPDVVLRGAPLALVSRSQRPLPARVEALKAHLLASVPSLLA